MTNKPKFGGIFITVLCNPDVGDDAIQEIKESITAANTDKEGIYSQYSTIAIKDAIKNKSLAVSDEDESILLKIAEHYEYIEI